MDITQAKQELRRTIRAYTAKTEDGVYRMPRRMQRPVLLMGPPGIGKTAILSQLAQEEHIGLVAYTMTHHTRQSALGLPVIVGRTAAGKTFRATEYTMSEIIASVYEQMEKTGLREGILFLDEINCVSETLMPAILQMLQNKTFGVHSLPEGWLIVAAGNPPRYNQSARSFDMATLDRVRCIELEPSLAAWQPYAAASGVHPAVLSYLRLHPEHFFLCSASAAAGEFATARGWEELSALLLAYEALGYPCTLAQMQQYLHAQEAAAAFAAFYDLFRRYAAQLPLEEILTGTACPEAGALRELPFDGRLSVVEFLLHSLQTKSAAMQQDADLAFSASSFAGSVPPGADALARVQELLQKRRAALAVRKDCGVLPPEEERRSSPAPKPRSRPPGPMRKRRPPCRSSRRTRQPPRRRAAKRPAARAKTACGLSRTRSARTRSSGSCSTACSTPAPPKPCRKTPPPSAPASSPKPPPPPKPPPSAPNCSGNKHQSEIFLQLKAPFTQVSFYVHVNTL